MCNCKRTLEQFSAPLSPLDEYRAWKAYGRPTKDDRKNAITVRELLAAGSDMNDIQRRIINLTNEIHPVFRDENICVCRYDDMIYRLEPEYANYPDVIEGIEESPEMASPYPEDNFMVRAALQLATLFITHDDTLPFWDGLIEAGLRRDEKTESFHVHPRRQLDQSRKEKTLEYLRSLADHIRLHFKVFTGKMASVSGRATVAQLTLPDCDETEANTCAYRDGEAVIESDDTRFVHMWLNAGLINGFDQSSDKWLSMSIKECKSEIFNTAQVIGHEFAHAMMGHFAMTVDLDTELFLNEESLAEAGFCWENFVFGGMVTNDDSKFPRRFYVVPWPSVEIYDQYAGTEFDMQSRRLGALQKTRWHPLLQYDFERFSKQSFWDASTPVKRFKKLWLRPYREVPISEDEYSIYSSGHEAPVEVSAKKQRLDDATIECYRQHVLQMGRVEPMARADRWHRRNEKLLELKDEFHDREKDHLNALWISCLKDFETKMFL